MGSLNGYQGSITGNTGSTTALEAKSGWRVYVCPRGIDVASAGSGSPIVCDSATSASRIAANQWFQVGTNTAKIRQCAAVGGNSFSYSGTAISVSVDDRIVVVGNTQPTLVGSVATYQPATTIYTHDDDSATPVTNSKVTTDSDGSYQFFKADGVNDLVVQDSNGACQVVVRDVAIGLQPGDLIPDTPYTRLAGTTTSPWGSVYHVGEIVSGITGAAGVTYHGFDTTGGWTQGNLFGFAINNVTKVYGDTHGGVFQSWTLPEVYNVKSARFGATGNGTTDDSAAVQAAIDAIPANSGGVVFFPPGNYFISSGLTVDKAGVVFQGSGGVGYGGGNYGPTKISATAAIVMLTAGNASTTEWNGIGLRDITFSGGASVTGGVLVKRMNQLRWDNVNFVGITAGYAMKFDGTGDWVQYGTLTNINVYNCKYGLRTAGNVNALNFVGGFWTGLGIASSVGAEFASDGDSCRLLGVAIQDFITNVYVTGPDHLAIIGCRFEMVGALAQTGIGVRVGTGSQWTNISDNTFGACNPAIQIDSGANYTNVGLNGYNSTLDKVTDAGSYTTMISGVVAGVTTADTWHTLLNNSLTMGSTLTVSGTVIGANLASVVWGTSVALPAGNLFGLSSSPAGDTTCTTLVTTGNNGRRVVFYGDKGICRLTDGPGIKTASTGIAINPLDMVEFVCIGSTWCQVGAVLAL